MISEFKAPPWHIIVFRVLLIFFSQIGSCYLEIRKHQEVTFSFIRTWTDISWFPDCFSMYLYHKLLTILSTHRSIPHDLGSSRMSGVIIFEVIRKSEPLKSSYNLEQKGEGCLLWWIGAGGSSLWFNGQFVNIKQLLENFITDELSPPLQCLLFFNAI